MIRWLLLIALSQVPVIDAGEAVAFPVIVRFLPRVAPPFRGLDLLDAMAESLRRSTTLRAVEVGLDATDSCGGEVRCLFDRAVHVPGASLGMAVIVSGRGTEVLLLSLPAVREVVTRAGPDTDVLAEVLDHAVLATAAAGSFRSPDELAADSTRFVEEVGRPFIEKAGVWGAAASVRVVFGGSPVERLLVNGSTVSAAVAGREVLVHGLRPRTVRLEAVNAWTRKSASLHVAPGEEARLRLDLEPGPGVRTARWIIGGGIGAGVAGATLLVGLSVANANGAPAVCFQSTGAPSPNATCHQAQPLVGAGAGLVGLGIGALVAGLLLHEQGEDGLMVVDIVSTLAGAALGAGIGAVIEVSQ